MDFGAYSNIDNLKYIYGHLCKDKITFGGH